MSNIQEHLKDMYQYIRGLKREIDVAHMEIYIESMAVLVKSKTSELLRYLDEINDGIYDALAKRLDPKIVNPENMRFALPN